MSTNGNDTNGAGTGSGTGRGAVLVTGTSSGLGLATAVHLAASGFPVCATVRNLDDAPAVHAAAAEKGVTLDVRRLDLTDAASIATTVDDVAAASGGIYALVNNGGIGLRACLEDTTEDEVRRVFEANVFGTIAVTKAVLPHMRAAGRGRVITISSVGGRISSFGVSVYCASKFAEEGLAEGLALELAPFGIQSILVEPGIVKTTRWTSHRGTTEGALDPSSPYHRYFKAGEALADKVVARSTTTSDDVAAAVHRALTDEKPRLRYVVGRKASAAILMRRYLPEPVFERVYFGAIVKEITKRATSGEAPAATRGAT